MTTQQIKLFPNQKYFSVTKWFLVHGKDVGDPRPGFERLLNTQCLTCVETQINYSAFSLFFTCHLVLFFFLTLYTMEYYSAIKKNIFESVLMRWMKLKPIIQSEVSQKEKHQYSILTHIYEIQKMVTITLYARQQKRHRCIEQSFGLCGRVRRGMIWENGIKTCIISYKK